MQEFKNMEKCFICSNSYQYGPHRYDGKYIKAYDIMACSNCMKANYDGWSPVFEEKILSHLKEKGLPQPKRNEKGWLSVKG